MHFGEHLTIDGYNCSYEKLDDKNLILNCLNEIPEILEMKKLSDPEIYFAPSNDIKDPGGWSGFVVIAESHISIHTFPKKRFLSADIYTCKNGLEIEKIKQYFEKKFEIGEIEENFIIRGKRYLEIN